MRNLKLLLIPACLTLLLVFMLFLPVIPTPNGSYTGCGPHGCVDVVQFGSISYTYGGWGALFQTGVNWYAVDGWMCSCPSNASNCCVPPYAGVVWGAVAVLFVVDLLSLLINRRWAATPKIPNTVSHLEARP